MSQERYEIPKEELVPKLWSAYKKSDEYLKEGRVLSINSVHRLMCEAEERGLERIYSMFLEELDKKRGS